MASAGEKIGPGDYFRHSGCPPFAVPYELCFRSHGLLFQNQVAIKMRLLLVGGSYSCPGIPKVPVSVIVVSQGLNHSH